MARPCKKGLEYFPFELGFFRNDDIRRIKSEFGAKGIMVLLVVFISVYENEGYYLRWDDDSCFFVSEDAGCGCSPNLVREVMQVCIKRGLFDEAVFNMYSVITSHKIQVNFQRVAKGRALKNPIEVDGRFWVLNENETESCIKVCPEKGFSENNPSNSENNPSNSENNSHKEKESKEKESKENIGATAQPPPSPPLSKSKPVKHKHGEYQHVLITDDQYSKLITDYGERIVAEYIKRLDEYLENHRKAHYDNHNLTIRNWLNKDGVKKLSEQSATSDKYEFNGW